MRLGRTIAFVMLALLAGGVVSQLPSAMGDSDDPFSALWDAIFDLQSRDNDLQAQINELKAERDALLVQTGSEPVFVSDSYAELEVETTEDGRTLVHITASNSGPDRAAGVKLTAFYLMPLFEINFIDSGQCEDKSRGIIECTLGTLEEGQESVITIDATARESGKANTWTVDISTTTEDADYTNNHATYDFETGSGEQIEIPQVEQPVQEEPEEEVQEPEAAEPEPEQGSESSSNSGETEPQESSGNQTSTENGPEETSGNQTSSETDSETVDDSGSNSTGTEDGSSEQPEESSSEEETSDGSAQEEQSGESETEEQVEEQGQDTSNESGTGESPQDASQESGSGSESSGSEESGSEESGDESSGEQESSEGSESGETTSQ